MGDLKDLPERPQMTPEEAQAADNALAGKMIKQALNPDPGEYESMGGMALRKIAGAEKDTLHLLAQMASQPSNEQREAMAAISEGIKQYLDEFGLQIAAAIKRITDFLGSDLYFDLAKAIPDAYRLFDIGSTNPEPTAEKLGLFGIVDFVDNLEGLLPFITEEAAAYREETGQALTAAEFVRDTAPNTGEQIESIYLRTLRHSKLPRHELLGGLPEKYVMPRDNITQSLTGRMNREARELEQIINTGYFDLPMVDTGKKTEVTAYTMIAGPEQLKGIEPRYRTVLYGVLSLIEDGRDEFTATDILRTIRQKGSTENNAPKTIKEVDEIMRVWRIAFLDSDLSATVQRMNNDAQKKGRALPFSDESGDPIVGYKIHENVLMLGDTEVVYGSGKVEHAYSVLYDKDGTRHIPKLLEFSKTIGQIIYADPAVMAIQKTKDGKLLPHGSNSGYNLNWQRTAIRDYLYIQIDTMKNRKTHKKAWTDKILFDTLYTYMWIDKADKKERMAARDWTFKCLDFWRAIGHIANYSVEKRGREYRGVIIELPKSAQ